MRSAFRSYWFAELPPLDELTVLIVCHKDKHRPAHRCPHWKMMRRLLTPLLLLSALALAPVSVAADEVIDTLQELRLMESRVSDVVQRNTPATVGLLTPQTGSAGSGVIVSPEGLILTAAHVIEGSQEVDVVFPDGSSVKGKVLGGDRTKDQGMVQIIGDGGPWPFVELGESVSLEVADWVVALGHPGGYDPVRTPPVRLGRVQSTNPAGFFTTDCKLIGGDSGGPLFDLDGRLVGIHSSIGGMRTTSVNNHAGISDFSGNWKRLKAGEVWGNYGEIDTPDGPFLGVAFGMSPQRGGVLITEVLNGSPASDAGIRPGDFVTALDAEAITNPTSFKLRIAQRRAGDTLNLTLRRNGRFYQTEATLTRRDTVGG